MVGSTSATSTHPIPYLLLPLLSSSSSSASSTSPPSSGVLVEDGKLVRFVTLKDRTQAPLVTVEALAVLQEFYTVPVRGGGGEEEG